MIAELQAKRKRTTDEWPRHDWDFKRRAIIASGMVEERRKEREATMPPPEYAAGMAACTPEELAQIQTAAPFSWRDYLKQIGLSE